MRKITLIVPPILSVARPSLGIGAIKAALTNSNCDVNVVYAALHFAELIGADLNQTLAEQTDHRLLVGDWIFSECLSDKPRTASDEVYLRSVLGPNITPALLDSVINTRSLAKEFIKTIAAEVCMGSPSIIGLTSTFQQHCAALALAKEIKAQDPNVKICIGGANCEEEMGKATLDNFPFIDFVFSGESDLTFPKFIKFFFEMNGQVSRQFIDPGFAEPILNLDALPIPDFSDYFQTLQLTNYGARVSPALTFEASRGCWWGAKHHCTFCGLNGSSMAFRAKSSSRVIEEVLQLSSHYSVKAFSPSDNILAPAHINEVFGELPEDLGLRFFYEVKSNMSHEQISKIARGGVTWVQPGIESLSDDVLKLMNKGVSSLLNIRFLKSCLEIGVVPLWNFLVGFPGESDDEYNRVARLIPYIEHIYPPQNGPSFIRVDRFSPYFTGRASDNFDSIEPLAAYSYVYDLNPKELRRLAYFFKGQSDRMISNDVHMHLADAIVLWRKRFWDQTSPPILASFAIGDCLLVRDTRSVAKMDTVLLDAPEVAIVAKARSPIRLDSHRSTSEVLAIQKLLDFGFLIQIGDQVMSVIKEFGWEQRRASELEEQPCGHLRGVVA